jgi:hypothetical protein
VIDSRGLDGEPEASPERREEMAPDEDEQSELDELEQLRSSPLRVSLVAFPQDLKTRSEKVLREFKPTASATTLQEVLKCTDEILVNLEDLGVFHEIDAEIVQGRNVRSSIIWSSWQFAERPAKHHAHDVVHT